ncbi:DUF3566 domain-containing protein [Stieleria sp. JC731]|uniref:DUF3566 domain-containing protein n=1 Tax=Pirellulaceae TaxID=2691357 RepID=UPI001E40B2E4|nr:DUF3566 domain-containing protein [Stieleria sp. JC731]MCC9604194.1 DUF3566 domain-containing protein [Stieleria sp. JC731]
MSIANPFDAPIESELKFDSKPSSITIKKVDVLSAGKIGAILYGVTGLITAAFMVMFALVGSIGNGDIAIGLVVALVMGVIIPVGTVISGFMGGVIFGFLYNVCASIVGGLQFEIDS